jgi:hypothetical protein
MILGVLINNDQEVAWCTMRDFNAICSNKERRSRMVGDRFKRVSHFNQFIDGSYLIN